jgi:hypothetical protein
MSKEEKSGKIEMDNWFFTWFVLIDLLTHVFQLLIVEFHHITKISSIEIREK